MNGFGAGKRVIWHPDIADSALHSKGMDAIRNIPELILEFISRRDFIALYLGAVGLWCLWLGSGGLRQESTKGFGWRASDLLGEEAELAGRAWLAIGSGLLIVGTGLWFTA